MAGDPPVCHQWSRTNHPTPLEGDSQRNTARNQSNPKMLKTSEKEYITGRLRCTAIPTE